MAPSYSDEDAALLYEVAVQTVAADPTRAERGGLNSNCAVPDPKSGRDVNVRIPKPIGERRPLVWRTYDEEVIHAALEAGGLGPVTAKYLYAHPQGLFSLQERSGADRLPGAGEPFAPDLARDFVLFNQALNDVELPGGPTAERPLAPDLLAHLETHAPTYRGQRTAPRTSTEYAELMACELEADANLRLVKDDFIARSLGVPDHPAEHARAQLQGLPDAPLVPTHPDMHSENLGVKNGHLFVYDLEMVGYHDRRHALVYADHVSPHVDLYEAFRKATIESIPSSRREDFVEGVRRWDGFAMIQRAVMRLGRTREVLEEQRNGQDLENILDRFSPWLTQAINSAAPLWGSDRTLDTAEVRSVLAESGRRYDAGQRFREAGLRIDAVARGFGALVRGAQIPPLGDSAPSPGRPANTARHSGRGLGLRRDRSL